MGYKTHLLAYFFLWFLIAFEVCIAISAENAGGVVLPLLIVLFLYRVSEKYISHIKSMKDN